jgi:nucleotide sugar dehydrogenase
LKVQVIGLGTVGLPTAFYIAQYHDTLGYDINEAVLKRASASIPTSKLLEEADVYVICVSTTWKNDEVDMSAIETVCNEIENIANEKTLVTIESTVLPGTCRKTFETIFRRQVKLANCPHRLWPADLKNYGVCQTRVLGAINEESMAVAKNFYESIKIPILPVSSTEVSEMSKIVENSYRFIEIAYAEEISLACEKHGLDFNEVRRACNTLKRDKEGWQVQILEARNGIGGACLPKDIMFLGSISKPDSLMVGAVLVDEYYRKWKFERYVK